MDVSWLSLLRDIYKKDGERELTCIRNNYMELQRYLSAVAEIYAEIRSPIMKEIAPRQDIELFTKEYSDMIWIVWYSCGQKVESM